MLRRLSLLAFVVSFLAATGALAQTYEKRPVISSLDPASGPPGATVMIQGKNFTKNHKVYFNGVELKIVKQSASEIVVKVPNTAVQGRFQVKGKKHEVTSPQVFWVVENKLAPAITSIAPTNGPPGTVLTISGRNFSAKAFENTVSIGKRPLAVKTASKTKIRATIPDGAKSNNITVKVFGTEQTTSAQTFDVMAKHNVETFEPDSGLPGTHVILRGLGLPSAKANLKVRLGGKICKIISNNTTEVVVEVPRQGADSGKFDVWVKGLGSVELDKVFEVIYPPRITEFAPAAGKAGALVTIRGERFGEQANEVSVLLTGRQCDIKAFSPTQISVVVPEGAVSGSFKVVNQRMGSTESAQAFDVWAPLAVTRVEPLFGLPGTEVKMWGSGFRIKAEDHIVYISDKKVPVKSVGQGVLTFDIPKDVLDGKVSMRLEVKDRGATKLPMPFLAVHTPEITGFSPKRGPIGTAVTITGRHFGKKTNHVRVRVGDLVVPIISVNPSAVTVSVPAGASTGKVRVETVRRGGVESKSTFEVYQPVQITGFLPTKGYPGQTVHIFGNGFEPKANQNKVTLGGKPLKVIGATPSRLKIKLDKTSQSGSIRIEVPERGTSESPDKLRLIQKVSVGTFKPARGVPGTYVTVKGKGFDNPNLRAFIGKTPAGVRVESPTSVTVAIPDNATKGKLTLRAPGAGRASSNAAFDVLTPLSIAAFEPMEGEAGSKVTIYGTGFDLGPKKTTVTFGDKKLKIEKGSSETALIVTIPKKAKDSATFKIAVIDRGEEEAMTPFTIERPQPVVVPGAAPTGTTTGKGVDDLLALAPDDKPERAKVDAFDPPEGGVGDVITINGAGFGEDVTAVKVWIGQVPTIVVGVVPDMVMVEVPKGVRSGKIRIKIGDKPMLVTESQFIVK